MAESSLAVNPVNTPGGAIFTFLFLMLLFIVIAAILWALFAGWDWPLSRRFRPASFTRFQTAIANGPGPATPNVPAESAGTPAAAGADAQAGGPAHGSHASGTAVTEGEAGEGQAPASGTPDGAP